MENIPKIVVGDNIFVYGTLRRGERAGLEGSMGAGRCKFVDEAQINGDLYSLGAFPGAKPSTRFEFSADDASITGDVFEITHESLGASLDNYEGFPHLYTRRQIETDAGDTVWVYVYNHNVSSDSLIVSGDWKQRQTLQPQSARAA